MTNDADQWLPDAAWKLLEGGRQEYFASFLVAAISAAPRAECADAWRYEPDWAGHQYVLNVLNILSVNSSLLFIIFIKHTETETSYKSLTDPVKPETRL